MKKFSTILSFLWIISLKCSSQSIINILPFDENTEFIMYAKDSPRFIDNDSFGFEELFPLKEGISNVRIGIYENQCYIHWDVCDDNTRSKFLIVKYTDNNLQGETIKIINNVPCITGRPLFYNAIDNHIDLLKDNFYKLYKIYADNTYVHIITLIVPKTQGFLLPTLSTNISSEAKYGRK